MGSRCSFDGYSGFDSGIVLMQQVLRADSSVELFEVRCALHPPPFPSLPICFCHLNPDPFWDVKAEKGLVPDMYPALLEECS